MKLNVYGVNENGRVSQTEVAKVLEVDAYDLMYGTVEDILNILDGVDDLTDDASLLKLIQGNWKKINALILDVFPEADESDLKRIKVKELVPVFIEIFGYVKASFGTEKN